LCRIIISPSLQASREKCPDADFDRSKTPSQQFSCSRRYFSSLGTVSPSPSIYYQVLASKQGKKSEDSLLYQIEVASFYLTVQLSLLNHPFLAQPRVIFSFRM